METEPDTDTDSAADSSHEGRGLIMSHRGLPKLKLYGFSYLAGCPVLSSRMLSALPHELLLIETCSIQQYSSK